MEISKILLKEFKQHFTDFNETVTDKDSDFYIVTVENNLEIGVIKDKDEGTCSFINIDKIDEKMDTPDFEYELLSLLADDFERDKTLENSYIDIKDIEDLTSKEIRLEDDLKRIKRIDLIKSVSYVIIFATIVIVGLVIEVNRYFGK